MIENITAVTNVGYAGLVCPYIRRRLLDAGKETKQAREVRVQKALEDAMSVRPIPQAGDLNRQCNKNGEYPINPPERKIVKHDDYGTYLKNVFA